MSAAATYRHDRGAPYYVFLASAAVFFVFLFPLQWIYGDQETAFDLLLPVAWLAMPVAGYLDVRDIRGMDDVDWTPRGWLWSLGFIFPILNLSAAVPYLLRRHEKVERRESWSGWWRLALAGAGLLFLVLMAGFVVEEYVYDSAAVEEIFTEATGLALVFGSVLSPVGVKYDVMYVKERYDWQPDGALWTLGAAIWFVNFFVLAAYAAKRNPDSEYSAIDEASGTSEKSADTGDDETVEWGSWKDADDEEPAAEDTEPKVLVDDLDSSWWYWPAATTALTVVLIVVGGYMLYSYSVGEPTAAYGFMFQIFNLLLLLVGLSFVSLYAIYRDAKAIEETDSDWQPFWVGYLLLGAFVSPLLPSLVYVVQRHRHLGTP